MYHLIAHYKVTPVLRYWKSIIAVTLQGKLLYSFRKPNCIFQYILNYIICVTKIQTQFLVSIIKANLSGLAKVSMLTASFFRSRDLLVRRSGL